MKREIRIDRLRIIACFGDSERRPLPKAGMGMMRELGLGSC